VACVNFYLLKDSTNDMGEVWIKSQCTDLHIVRSQ
jgi:hypothetical protein